MTRAELTVGQNGCPDGLFDLLAGTTEVAESHCGVDVFRRRHTRRGYSHRLEGDCHTQAETSANSAGLCFDD